jgi:hypothetical protein
MRNIFLSVMLLFVAACSPLRDLSISTSDCLTDPQAITSQDVVVVPKDTLPKEIVESDKFKDKSIIIAPTDMLKKDCTKLAIVPDPKNEGGWSAWLLGLGASAAGIASIFIPQLAALEALLALLSRRKREHYVAAVKNILPYDGNIDMKGAVNSLAKAMGILHTNKGTEKPDNGSASQQAT